MALCVVVRLCASEVVSYISYLYTIKGKPVDEPSHAEYLRIIVQTACSLGEHPLLCPSSGVSDLSQVASVPCFFLGDPLPPCFAARFVTPTHYSHHVRKASLFILIIFYGEVAGAEQEGNKIE